MTAAMDRALANLNMEDDDSWSLMEFKWLTSSLIYLGNGIRMRGLEVLFFLTKYFNFSSNMKTIWLRFWINEWYLQRMDCHSGALSKKSPFRLPAIHSSLGKNSKHFGQSLYIFGYYLAGWICSQVSEVAYDPIKTQRQDFVRMRIRSDVSKPLRRSKAFTLPSTTKESKRDVLSVT